MNEKIVFLYLKVLEPIMPAHKPPAKPVPKKSLFRRAAGATVRTTARLGWRVATSKPVRTIAIGAAAGAATYHATQNKGLAIGAGVTAATISTKTGRRLIARAAGGKKKNRNKELI
ncbi:MAG: hypothetical protein AABW99_02450 [archaeon]